MYRIDGGERLKLLICNETTTPIYAQISSQIRSQILRGELQPGESLPSIRSLSRELQISVITVKRAYENLEEEKLIYTKPGIGSFVSSQNLERIKEFKLAQLQESLLEILEEANRFGIEKKVLMEMLELL